LFFLRKEKTVKISSVKTVLKEMLLQKVPVTPFLWGPHGIGKTSIIAQLGKEVGYNVVTVMLSQKEAVDIAGVLYTYEDKDLGMSVTASHPPKWFATAIKRGKVILFFDEFNLARRETSNAAYQIILDRVLEGLELPDTCFVVAAGNPQDERYDVVAMPENLIDRFLHIRCEADLESFYGWAKTRVHDDVIAFLKHYPQLAYTADAKDTVFPVEIKHSLRSVDRLSKIHGLNLPTAIKTELYRGTVGAEVAAAFVKSLTDKERPFSLEEICNFGPLQEERLAVWVKNSRSDLMAGSIDSLADNSEKDLSASHEAIVAFMSALPKEVAMMCIKKLYHKDEGKWSVLFMGNQRIKSLIGNLQETVKIKKSKKE
jgi:MoxR-like ATPase